MFPCTRVEIVDFPNGDAGDFEEQDPITGPFPEQINRVLKFLKDKLVKEKVIKPADKAESIRIASYPYQAIEETLVNAFYHRDYQQREPIEIRIYPNSIVFINHGGPDRSIRLESFNSGQVRNRRYRNRRLGEFLKELELTEGRATGIPTILKSLKDNSSPAPRFYTNDDRTFFEVELFIHAAFAEKTPIKIDLETIQWNLQGIDKLLNVLVERVLGGTVRDIARDIDIDIESIESQYIKVLGIMDGDIARDIAGDIAEGIAGGIAEKTKLGLISAMNGKGRNEIMADIKLVNNVKNYNTYIAPLLAINWLTMTIPDKPTSPNQKYLTTLKGRLVLEILKKSGIGKLESGKNKKA